MASTSIPAAPGTVRRTPKRLLALRSDDHLVARVRGADEAAFEVLYERYAANILSFCRHMLSDAQEAEDAVQQVFLSAHGDLSRDQREIRVKPWLYAIARNRCLSILRMRREQTDRDPDCVTAGLTEEVERRADLRELVADLRDLPDDQRAALVLTELGDLAHADVAEVLGCRPANVKGLVYRARSGLIERREARAAACEEIRVELASARYGALRRGRLRHHLAACPGCHSYLEEVRNQRRMMAAVLPVVPSITLKHSVLAAAGIGGGGAAAGGGGLAAGGLGTAVPAANALFAKVAVVGALAGSAAVAGEAALESDPGPRGAPAAPAREHSVDPLGRKPPTGLSPFSAHRSGPQPEGGATAGARSEGKRDHKPPKGTSPRGSRGHAKGYTPHKTPRLRIPASGRATKPTPLKARAPRRAGRMEPRSSHRSRDTTGQPLPSKRKPPKEKQNEVAGG